MEKINKFPTEIIDLPSQGYFYPPNNPLSKGQVEIKYMTAREEDILTSRNLIQKGVVIDTLLKSLIVTPIDYNDLLIGDKNAILIASRILAYGKEYNVEILCQSCGEKSRSSIDLTEFKNKEINLEIFKKGENVYFYTLPLSNVVLELSLSTHKIEQTIESHLKGLKKISAQTGIDSEMTTRLKNIILSVNGDSTTEAINKFVSTELLAKDSLELRKFIRKNTPDIDMSHIYTCPSCSAENIIQIPLTVDFFWPTGRE